MRWITSGVAILASVMGLTMEAVAGNRGLSPIILSANLTAVGTTMTDASPSISTVPATPQAQYDAVFSICQAVVPASHADFLTANVLTPTAAWPVYFQSHGLTIEQSAPLTINLVEGPRYGQLQSEGYADGVYAYRPNEGYLGSDQMTFVVEAQGKKFKVIESVYVSRGAPEYGPPECPDGFSINELPNSGKASGKGSALDILELPTEGPLDAEALAKLHSAISFSIGVGGLGDGGLFNFTDLPNAAIGQTTGNSITLDTNASGYNWFIDTTPADNSEFLPTSNPNEWVAKAGGAAAGKMDMLSVLLHEYGHALGIEHSADNHDYMATTLTPGVRRMPSAEEMALMQSLVAQAKVAITESTPSLTLPLQGGGDAPSFPTLPLGTSFIGFLGLLRGSRYGGVSIAPDANTLVTQYAWAANTTLVNGSLNAIDGWSTQGGVEIIPPSTGSGRTGGATLTEVSGSQTRLSQVFLLNPTDRFLSFTLSGTALDDLTGAPDDAFEVALLDANTGASLLSGTGQTRTDAFLNLQADGTQNLANCVTCINNADGSRTYRVDLAGVPAGIAANLSFDLIGFGQNGSHVTVSDVRLSGLPQLHDETATMLEDGTLAFDPFAQVDNAAVLQLGSHVVDQPAHGAVTVNTDGTFSYTPTADYFGTDSFTYRLSDGPLESNLATVSITLTPVNDAPVVADVQATTAEDTALVIALGAYATDVDLLSTAGGGANHEVRC